MNDNNKPEDTKDNSTPSMLEGKEISTEYASFTRRLYSSLIDLTIMVFLLTYIISPLVYGIYGLDSPTLFFKSQVAQLNYNVSQIDDEAKIKELQEQTFAKIEDYFFVQGRINDYFTEQFAQISIIAAIVIAFWYFKAGTPGKLLLRLRVVDAKSGSKPDLFQCILRVIGYAFSIIPLCIGFFWMKYSKRSQCFHDMIAGTVVVRIIPHE